MAPAPRPRGIDNKQRAIKLSEKESPSKAAAVSAVQMAVNLLVPIFRIKRTLNKLDVTEQMLLMTWAMQDLQSY